MEILKSETIEILVVKLCNHSLDDEVTVIQETYNQLKASLTYTLFSLNNVPQDHYSWILIDQDAKVSLDKLLVAHKKCQAMQSDASLRLAYKRELDDFRWIVITAISCKPF